MPEPKSGDKTPGTPRDPEKNEFLTPRVKHDRWLTPPPKGWEDGFGGGYRSDEADPGRMPAGDAGRERLPETHTTLRDAPPQQKTRILSVRKIFRDIVFPLLVAFVVAMFAQATVAKPYQIPSGSMLPTIQLQDRVLANRFIYRLHPVERGDVIVFTPPASVEQETPYVKRVIGLPGDVVEITRGKTLVNGEEFEVPTASIPTYTRAEETVPVGMLFVLGDNRNESSDSHIWGYVPEDNVIGRADIVYWPPKNLHLLGN